MGIIEKSLENLKTDTTQIYENMQVTPLILEKTKSKDYLILDEAIKQKVAKIVEVSESGSVPELKFENSSKSPILLLDGEELIGAKQNRIVNLTILVGPERTINIPVSCVEAGRWSSQSQEFTPSERAVYSKMRASKAQHVSDSMKSSGNRRSNQGEIWNSIEEKMQNMDSHSHTAAMSQIFDDNKHSLDDYVNAFSYKDNQCGAVFSINGKIKGMEMFDSEMSFKLLMSKVVQSYALDALEERQKDSPLQTSQDDIQKFLSAIGIATTREFSGTDLGTDVRLDASEFSGGGLIHENALIHLCVFPALQTSLLIGGGSSPTIQRASQRGQTFH